MDDWKAELKALIQIAKAQPDSWHDLKFCERVEELERQQFIADIHSKKLSKSGPSPSRSALMNAKIISRGIFRTNKKDKLIPLL